MHKIYSRPRIKIPNFKYNEKLGKNKKKIIYIATILIIAFSVVNLVLRSILPIFNELSANRAMSIATMVSNEQATVVMSQHSYDELFTIEKDNEGNVKMIKSNIIAINEITSDVAIKIQDEINKKGREDIEIALGSFTGFKLLSGRGPGVKIRISSIGNVETDLKSEFISQGINQTIHRVYLNVKCEVSILTPFENITKEVVNQVLLLENVIVGNIPSTYYNLEGLEQRSDAIEVIE